MKIIKKTKQFVKKNWKPIVTGGCVGIGSYVVYVLGVNNGFDSSVRTMNKMFGIDLENTFGSGTAVLTLKDVIGDEIPKELMDAGFTSLDDKIQMDLLMNSLWLTRLRRLIILKKLQQWYM